MKHETQGALLQRRLKELGWGYAKLQEKLAERGLSVSTQAIQKWVTGGGGMSDDAKFWTSQILGIDLGYLVRASIAQKNGGSLPPFDDASERLAS